MNAHWELIIAILMQFAQIFQEVIHVRVKQDILGMVLIVLVRIFSFFLFFVHLK